MVLEKLPSHNVSEQRSEYMVCCGTENDCILGISSGFVRVPVFTFKSPVSSIFLTVSICRYQAEILAILNYPFMLVMYSTYVTQA